MSGLTTEKTVGYSLYFDGASRGNPGLASFGGVIYTPYNTELITYTQRLPEGMSNNVAEYGGLLRGLQLAYEYGIDELHVFGDSKLIISQMNGEWKVKHEIMKMFYDACKELEGKFSKVTYSHILRKYNKRADALANLALDT